MKFITLDFETYYGDDFTLSKMTTESYIRDSRFETLILGYQIDDDPPHSVIGGGKIQMFLDSLDVENSAMLAHHAHFDGLILAHHFNHRPKVWFDTLSMARALHGTEVGGSLGKLAEYYGTGEKGTEVIQAKGKRLADFHSEELAAYASYCRNDVRLTRQIFLKMLADFPKRELKIIDMVIRMFTEPGLYLDKDLLEEYVQTIQAEKATQLFEAGVTLDEVMSNDKFAAALQRAGVTPPEKISPTTGKRTWAFAKTDKGLIDLQEHPSDQVQALVAARLGNKSTLNESRASRMADMAARGAAPIYLNYSGAMQTHRLSGGDSMNWQNMTRGSPLRAAIYAPEGYVVMAVDSRNIEARILDWLAMQEDAVEVYRKFDRGEGPDVYCVMAEKLYKHPVSKAEFPRERQLGKVIKLACGYQMGWERFKETARIMEKLYLTDQESMAGVEAYREAHPMVKVLWNRAQNALSSIATGPEGDRYLDSRGLLEIEKGAILLPNGLRVKYPGLAFDSGTKWSFSGKRGERKKVYGGLVVENVVQALARIVVLEQTLEIHKHIPVRMSVHDEGVFLVPENDAQAWLEFAIGVMSVPPKWAPDLPVAASGGVAKRYGEIDK